MKQYRITTENLPKPSPDDCYLAPDDPIHEIINQSLFGGLGAASRAHNLKMSNHVEINNSNKGKIQRENNIKPGTDDWFKLWFSKEQD